MKTTFNISLIAFAMVLVTSCQKDELDRLGVEKEDVMIEQRFSTDEPVEHTSDVSEDAHSLPVIDPGIVVKEVSDGDEESDDDEVTSN